ncbi:MAG: acyltransferase domain-containing protein [Kordiimonadaceae bacterium]|nr:acyltransferase domain-containing protein [Kordiimonadaceae bacterium]
MISLNQNPQHSDEGRKTCLLFSGQGSQCRQMGRELYEAVPVFRNSMIELDQAFQQEAGRPILPELYGDNWRKSDPFDQTEVTHPAIFMLQLSLARAVMAEGVQVDAVLGSSLGEYVGAAVSGAVDGSAMMRTIVRSAQAIEQYCSRGAMLSVLASQSLYHDDPYVQDKVTFAGNYMAELFVVAGDVEAVRDVKNYWNARDVMAVILPVSHAFHSNAMEACASALEEIFTSLDIKKPAVPFYSSALGRQLETLDAQHFLRVGRGPINFAETLVALSNTMNNIDFVDVGPFSSLAGIVKKSPAGQMGSKCYGILSPFGNSHEIFQQMLAEKCPNVFAG